MTEGGNGTRAKRNGLRALKNPPQPHMCIQDYIQGTTIPCYINVLSWDKVQMPCVFTRQVPFCGGIRMSPPRTKTEAIVFAVLANPEFLKINGKNAQDPKKRSTVIELLLDFVEAMNTDIVFTRRYTILKDRDITGELKEVWNAVQTKETQSPPMQQETWIDAQPPVQYPQQYPDQSQQEYAPPPPQPPQYPSNFPYGRPPPMSNDGGMHFKGYVPQPPQTPVITINDQMYPSGQVFEHQQQYRGNISSLPPQRMPQQDRYNCRGRGRGMLVPNVPQPNCPAYPATQFQFQQVPGQMVPPQFINSNVHPNMNISYEPTANVNVAAMAPNMGTNMPDQQPYAPYFAYKVLDSIMPVEYRHLHQRPQQQMHMQNHVPPILQPYEQPPQMPLTYNTNPPPLSQNVIKPAKPHMGVAQKNNVGKRLINSPTHPKPASCTNCYNKDNTVNGTTQDNGTKPKSPVKVLQREPSNTTVRQEPNGTAVPQSTTESIQEKEKITNSNDSREQSDPVLVDPEPKTEENDNLLTECIESNRDGSDNNTSSTSEEEIPVSQKDTKINSIHCNQEGGKSLTKSKKYKDNSDNNGTIRIQLPNCDQKNDNKRSQTVNSIIKSVFKKYPAAASAAGGEEEHISNGKRKINGHRSKSNTRVTSQETDDEVQGYTILKKPDIVPVTQDDLTNEIVQMSIQDCKETTTAEVDPVIS